ncbi:hypothetical protein MZM54_00130 [[Brevibacterium] frigoritolerans]|nr:hypothetical protein [Peribacillus frigoritolerans]
MPRKKRKGSIRKPTISNTGFIGSVFIDTEELYEKSRYYFSRKHLQITHHTLNSMLKVISNLFNEQNVPAHLSCVYLKDQKKLGVVLSKNEFSDKEGVAYFINYLKEMRHYIEKDKKDKVDYEIFNTGFIGAVFADIGKFKKFTFDIEMNIIESLIRGIMIPVKELFLENKINCYISGVEMKKENKLGFVLSVKPFDEKRESILYFEEYLIEQGYMEGREEELGPLPIRNLTKEIW